MSIHAGTVAGLYFIDGAAEVALGGTRINHAYEAEGALWVADGKGRILKDGSVVATLPDGTTANCVQPSLSTTWVGSQSATLYRLDGELLSEDEFFADAPGRDSWHTPWGGPPDVRSMALSADRTLYINVHVGGILRYDNTGLVPTLDVDSDVHQVTAHPDQEGKIFAACAYGLAASHDGHNLAIRDEGLHAAYCRAVAVTRDLVFVSASAGPSSQRGRVYRGSFWEGAFEPLTGGLPEWFEGNVNTHCLLATDDALYIGFDDTIWVSEDSGSTFTTLVSGLPKVTCLT